MGIDEFQGPMPPLVGPIKPQGWIDSYPRVDMELEKGWRLKQGSTIMSRKHPGEEETVLGYIELEHRWAVVMFLKGRREKTRPIFNVARDTRGNIGGDNLVDYAWIEGLRTHHGQEIQEWMPLPKQGIEIGEHYGINQKPRCPIW